MSCVYDGIVLFGVLFFFGYAFSALAQFHGESGLARTLFQLYLFCLLGAYFGWFWSNGRWSLPMKTIGVKVVRDDGPQGPVSLPRALWRYTVASIFFWGGLALVWTAGSAITAVLWVLLWLLPLAGPSSIAAAAPSMTCWPAPCWYGTMPWPTGADRSPRPAEPHRGLQPSCGSCARSTQST